VSTASVRTRAGQRLAERREAERRDADAAPRPVLTGRALVMGLVLALLVFTLAVPARSLFRQRAEIGALRADTAASADRVAALQAQTKRLEDPAYVQSLIRDRLHYVLPGDVGYTVLDPSEAPAPAQQVAAANVDSAWYQRLWSSVEAADGDPAVTSDGEPRVQIRPDAPR
jgi:cell division protein FtsB